MNEQEKERRRALYNALLANGNKYVFQQDIFAEIAAYYPPLDGRAFHDSTARVIMSRDISEINRSPAFDLIVISTPKGLKIADKEEARSMIESRMICARREMSDITVLMRKFDNHGQKDVNGNEKETVIGG